MRSWQSQSNTAAGLTTVGNTFLEVLKVPFSAGRCHSSSIASYILYASDLWGKWEGMKQKYRKLHIGSYIINYSSTIIVSS